MNQIAPTTPRFDSNRAWQDAAAAVSANRDVLIALVGVFIVVPAFALAVLLPMPEPQPGTAPEAILDMVAGHFQAYWYYYIAAGLLNTVGTLALLALFGHASRPTVGEAIRRGLAATPTGIIVQLIQGLILTSVVLLPGAVLGAAGAGFGVLGFMLGLGAAAWLWVRLGLASPAIVVEGQRNPIAALQRSLALTRGNGGRLLLFLALLVVAFVVAMQLIQVAVTLITQGLAGAEAAKLVGALVAAVLQGAMTAYIVAALSASHRQLAGPDRADFPQVFG
ncbi:MAG: hypothetical protein GXC70_09020 [Sphingomonadaceae bacterium]|nr:hypothetical protein [Sphingomonadaceae bacterium]